jgi:hypothetical protein
MPETLTTAVSFSESVFRGREVGERHRLAGYVGNGKLTRDVGILQLVGRVVGEAGTRHLAECNGGLRLRLQ